MIKTYFKIAWRNMMKSKVFSFINIFGLTIGLTCCMLISMYLFYELSYDSDHKNGDRVYQLGTAFVKEGKEDRNANTPAPMARMMQMTFPEIEKATRMCRTFAEDKTLLQYTDSKGVLNSFNEPKGYLADSNFFQVLTYNFIEGNPETALLQPNTLVLSEEIARKIFGNESALNKVIRVSSSTNGDFDFNVTGVFAEPKVPSHIDARFFMSINGGGLGQAFGSMTSLASNNMFHTYFLLKKGTDPKQLEAKFPAFIDQYAGKDLKFI
jgi:putative ABC transport system permease protein